MFYQTIDDDLRLRLLEPRDADALFRLLDESRAYLREWLPFLDANQSSEETRAFILSGLQRYAAQNGAEIGLWYRGEIAGVLGLHYIDWANRSTSLGYWLGERYQGKGIMTRACRAVIDILFREYGLNRVEIRAATGNHKSRAVAERLGFQYEGCKRQAEWLYDHYVDHAVYSMLAGEWPSLQAR
ncbi:GNAT family N-acetyltransferase [Alicyclobacillus acidocaldarius]|uniref:GCN5-related N-acetyltransferase n=1 Tax=Alicyclobacillus acidocaldarius subsp. acidocaldarius (strain ATCC 27009 / DSM 446 / BCRC 14685 / JCM 5260 / KCTC 1825 / NBRC 15652 / NCIMB 11725 / NRRL B-14509 / 104-IA) TaxID=521098 RepID=C8WTI5_ALIAD|nr:GNAT family protein [Alicyclobacillus acidocaldarius]ACV57727.1 GCN5-related N-acetyltransferase [Alicyclobacillus acidocaldarius subsp. acidocaldarius DSM 446]